MSETRQLLHLIRTADPLEAFEAAKLMLEAKPAPVKALTEIMRTGTALHHREAAAYALNFIQPSRQTQLLTALMEAAGDSTESVVVRSQALEGIGYQCVSRRHELWSHAVEVVRRALADPDPSLAFWACFAAGSAKMSELRDDLRRLAEQDARICPGWWGVADEACDALGWLEGKDTPDRHRQEQQHCGEGTTPSPMQRP